MTSLLELDTRQEEETKEEPPKKWRNWWRVTQRLGHGANAIDTGSLVHVLRDYDNAGAAEAHAVQDMRERFARRGVFGSFDNCLTYLGAYPEGEKPDV